MPPRLIHLHIPKTAGTAVNNAIEHHYPPERICPHVYEQEFQDGDVSKFDFFKGHFGFDHACTLDGQIIVMLRDPVDRFISCYYYWRALYEHEGDANYGAKIAATLPLEEFVERFDEPVLLWQFFNRMTWQLASDYSLAARRAALGKSRNAVLAQARSNLAKCAVVGRQEDMPRFVKDMRAATGLDLTIEHLNVTAERPSYEDVPLAIRRRIMDWVQLDLELYWSLTRNGGSV